MAQLQYQLNLQDMKMTDEKKHCVENATKSNW